MALQITRSQVIRRKAIAILVSLGFATPALAVTDVSIKCPKYKVFYIDPATQFFSPPVPLEEHAEYVFCTEHSNLDEIRTKLKTMKPVRSKPDENSGRIKVIPRGKADETLVFCSTGEITFKGKQYRLDRRAYEPALLSIRAEADKQRDKEADPGVSD